MPQPCTAAAEANGPAMVPSPIEWVVTSRPAACVMGAAAVAGRNRGGMATFGTSAQRSTTSGTANNVAGGTWPSASFERVRP